MENTELKQKRDVQTFFAESKISSDSSSFKENLKTKVLEHYINVNNQPPMKDKLAFLGRRPEFLLFGALALFFILSVPAVLLLSKNTSQLNPILGAEVSLVEGSVEYKSPTTDWVSVNSNVLLKQGDSLRVNGEGKAVVNLDDGSAVRLNKDSGMTLTSLDAKHITISNDKGEIYTRFVKSDRVFEVKAKEITYKSLGTAYKTINTESQNGVEVYHNSVSILGVNGQNEILVEQGNKYFVVDTTQPQIIQKVTAVDINVINKDAFVKWNKDQDELISDFKSEMGILFDLTPPTLTINAPTDGQKVTSEKITVTGTTEADTKITINEAAVTNNNGVFSFDFGLNVGTNAIKISTEDSAGNKTIVNLNIIREVVQTPPPAAGKITLSATKTSTGINFSWSVSGLDVSKGFKLLKSKTAPNPTYPDGALTFIDGSKRSYSLSVQDGKTYYFRICQYTGSACAVYSNNVTITAPTPTGVTSITLNANQSTKKVSWSVNGYSPLGFKVVWSKTSGPTYPLRGTDQYQYFDVPSTTTSNVLDPFDGAGTYYVRVCEYKGGACGVYSNQVTIDL